MSEQGVSCICCGKKLGSAIDPSIAAIPGGAWYNPAGGVGLESVGGNYGSAVFDEITGWASKEVKVLECVICDVCLRAHPDRWRITEGEILEGAG